MALNQAAKWDENAHVHDIGGLCVSIKKYGFRDAPIYDGTLEAVPAGNGRLIALEAMQKQGDDPPLGIATDAAGQWYVPLQFGIDASSRAAARAFGIDHNNLVMAGADFAVWDVAKLWEGDAYIEILQSLAEDDELPVTVDGDDLDALLREMGLDDESADDPGAEVDRAEELREKWQVETGQMWQLGEHRIICGDCTDASVVERVMGGENARMMFTDPPYGIGKDIENDNLKGEQWTQFYADWTTVALSHLIDNAYCYVWGYFDTLSDYWQEVIKARGDCNFRNFIVWRKNYIQGRNAEEFRQFPEEYAAALLFIFGQPFQNGPWSTSPNAEHYPEMFEPLRSYLDGERKKMGWDIMTVKKIVGHSDLARDHWFGRSQWSMPTREVYEKMQAAASSDAFRREYDAFRREYDDLRREYDDLRGYFDNTNGFTDVWQFDKLTTDSRHPTVKPVEVCERGVMTTSQDGELVLDVFLGSGSTLIACEQLGRRCRGVEISPAYIAVTLERWADMTGNTPHLITEPSDG